MKVASSSELAGGRSCNGATGGLRVALSGVLVISAVLMPNIGPIWARRAAVISHMGDAIG
jgi:hypothetical protein